MDSIEESFSNPIIIPLKPKKFKSNDVKQRSQGVKPFKCEICDAGFMKKINLKRHIKVHEKAKPYNFGTSDATFTSKGIMKNHKATVHGGQKQNIHFDFAPTENTSVYLIEQNSKKSVTNPRIDTHIVPISRFHKSESLLEKIVPDQSSSPFYQNMV